MLHVATTETKQRNDPANAAPVPEPRREFHSRVASPGAYLHGGPENPGDGGLSWRQSARHLQRTMGNRALMRMVDRRAARPPAAPVPTVQLQRKCACGGSGGECESCKGKRAGYLEGTVGETATSLPHSSQQVGQIVEDAGETHCDLDRGKMVWSADQTKFPSCMAPCVQAHEEAHVTFGKDACVKVSAAYKAVANAMAKAKKTGSTTDLDEAEKKGKEFEKAVGAYEKWFNDTCRANERQAYQSGIDACKKSSVVKACTDSGRTDQYNKIMKDMETLKNNPLNCPAAKESEKKREETAPPKDAPPKKKDEPPKHKLQLPASRMHCACGGSCPRCSVATLQPKLTVNAPGDRFEQEAERAADAVVQKRRFAVSSRSGAELHRQDGGEQAPGSVPEVVHEVLSSPGVPLDRATQSCMERGLDHDFSGVRIHTGAKAAESARAVSARAYTVGNDVVFGHGQFAPHTPEGNRLLAHELAHVLQQSSPLDAGARSPLARTLMRTAITDGYITFNTEAAFLTQDFTQGDEAVRLLQQAISYQKVRDDVAKAFKAEYGGSIPTSVSQYHGISGNAVLCGNDAAGCCKDCHQNCGSLGISVPSQFTIFAELRTGGFGGLVTPSGFPVTERGSVEVATASVMYHELLHLWFYQYLCVHLQQNRLHPSGHNGAYDALFAKMWGDAQREIEAAYKSRKKTAPPTAAAKPQPSETRTLPKSIEDLGKEHDRQTKSSGEFQFELGGGGVTDFRKGEGGNLTHPIVWGKLGYQFSGENTSRLRWRLMAGGFLVPGEKLGGMQAQVGLRLLQTDDVGAFGRVATPVESPFYFDFNAGALYRLDGRPGGVSSGGVSGGVGVGKIWQLGSVQLEVGANADYLYQWQLENPHAIIFGGHGALHF